MNRNNVEDWTQGGDAEAVALEAIEAEFNELDTDTLISILESLCGRELKELVRLAAERELENRIETSLQDEADAQVEGEPEHF